MASEGAYDRSLIHEQVFDGDWPVAALQELDFGVVVVTTDSLVVFANHVARTSLNCGRPLKVHERRLVASDVQDSRRLHEGVCEASTRGLRKLVALGHDAARTTIAIVPMPRSDTTNVLVMLSRRAFGGPLAIEAYARSRGLTWAESRVLVGLCAGRTPQELAGECSLEISTIRSQILSVRQKTGARSIRALITEVASLPPFTGILSRADEPAAPAYRRAAASAAAAPAR